jgi:hypothetical protein
MKPMRTYKDKNNLTSTAAELATIEKVRTEFQAEWLLQKARLTRKTAAAKKRA